MIGLPLVLVSQTSVVRIVDMADFPFKVNKHDYGPKLSRPGAQPGVRLLKGSPVLEKFNWEEIFRGASITLKGPDYSTKKWASWDWFGNVLDADIKNEFSSSLTTMFEVKDSKINTRLNGPLMFLSIDGSRGSSSLPTLRTWAFVEPQKSPFVDIRFSLSIRSTLGSLEAEKGNSATFDGVVFKTISTSFSDGIYRVTIAYLPPKPNEAHNSWVTYGLHANVPAALNEYPVKETKSYDHDGTFKITLETIHPIKSWDGISVWKAEYIHGFFEKVAMQPVGLQ
jgi:hypothetical protein